MGNAGYQIIWGWQRRLETSHMTTAVTISERAARRIGEILKTEGDGAMLRISVEGGGCSGFQYKFDVEHAQADDDLVIAREGAVVLVDPASVPFLAGSEVDFVDDLIGAPFRLGTPNAPAACGWEKSFSVRGEGGGKGSTAHSGPAALPSQTSNRHALLDAGL